MWSFVLLSNDPAISLNEIKCLDRTASPANSILSSISRWNQQFVWSRQTTFLSNGENIDIQHIRYVENKISSSFYDKYKVMEEVKEELCTAAKYLALIGTSDV